MFLLGVRTRIVANFVIIDLDVPLDRRVKESV